MAGLFQKPNAALEKKSVRPPAESNPWPTETCVLSAWPRCSANRCDIDIMKYWIRVIILSHAYVSVRVLRGRHMTDIYYPGTLRGDPISSHDGLLSTDGRRYKTVIVVGVMRLVVRLPTAIESRHSFSARSARYRCSFGHCIDFGR